MRENDPLHRLKCKRGSGLPQSKLNEKLVAQIRRDYQRAQKQINALRSRYTAKALAREYGIHHRAMERMLAGETWSHVPDLEGDA